VELLATPRLDQEVSRRGWVRLKHIHRRQLPRLCVRLWAEMLQNFVPCSASFLSSFFLSSNRFETLRKLFQEMGHHTNRFFQARIDAYHNRISPCDNLNRFSGSTSLGAHTRLPIAVMNLNPYLDAKLNAHTRFLFAPSSIQAHHIIPGSKAYRSCKLIGFDYHALGMLERHLEHECRKTCKNRRGQNKLRVAANGASIGALGQKLSRSEVAMNSGELRTVRFMVWSGSGQTLAKLNQIIRKLSKYYDDIVIDDLAVGEQSVILSCRDVDWREISSIITDGLQTT
ncbi:hypothetical protein PIB30_080952, partial [Stylosanthes scabra]|nr:hypothetical protein [Stylosanthes scabra]